ncbi:sodium:solute symporter family protein [Cytobacillus firmus]|uniref:Sodium:solute symporter family protein n=1 Tax=Cytobacillus firmus TaxID=1399 RepID=A0AA46SL93_CYTFI|nr:sodium:solute symporter family protein [Cytobacillus firmus]UYG98107.1 sodium:solute symporter family protein [Cytobacillus firmus]
MGIIDWICVVGYFALLGLIGYQTSKGVKSVEDYNVAGEKVTWPILFASLAASVLGGGASTGMAGNVFKDGYVFMFAFCAYGVASVLIGYFIAPRLKAYKGAQTVGDIMEKHYGKMAKLLTGILSVGLCTGILGGQALALGTIFNVILDIPPIVGILIGMGVVILYTSFGGVWAVIQTDVVQFVLLGVILPVTLIIGLFAAGGTDTLIEKVPSAHLTFLGSWELVSFIGLFVTFLLGEALIPPYTQRVFSSKDPEHSRKGYMISGFFSFGFFFITGSLGLVAYVLFPDIQTDQALPTIVKNLLPVGVTGLAVSALLAVIMSTASSFLNATTVSFMQDIYFPFLSRKKHSEKHYLFMEKALTLIVGIGSVIFALSVPSIIAALEYSYYLWAPTIVFPLVMAIMWKIYNVTAGLCSIIVGAAVTLIWTFVLHDPFSLSGVVPGVIANMIAFFIAYSLNKNSSVECQPSTAGKEMVENDAL